MTDNKNNEPEQLAFNLTDSELDELLKQEMRDQGYKVFINYQGQEEDL